MGANGIETDVQLTKDGIPVLFHDDTLVRMTGEEGSISDYTFEELQNFNVTKNEYIDKIVKLEDFIKHFHFRDITFAIELKQRGTAKPTVDILRKYNMSRKVTITSFNFEELCDVRQYAPEYKAGYLTNNITDELLSKMMDLGIDEICPEAHLCNAEIVRKWHHMGFNVRAWGVYNEDLMKQAYESGCDGMTVNFPDKLTKYIADNQ
jgi:glycerophosphoryl diester phosphodiesterase